MGGPVGLARWCARAGGAPGAACDSSRSAGGVARRGSSCARVPPPMRLPPPRQATHEEQCSLACSLLRQRHCCAQSRDGAGDRMQIAACGIDPLSCRAGAARRWRSRRRAGLACPGCLGPTLLTPSSRGLVTVSLMHQCPQRPSSYVVTVRPSIDAICCCWFCQRMLAAWHEVGAVGSVQKLHLLPMRFWRYSYTGIRSILAKCSVIGTVVDCGTSPSPRAFVLVLACTAPPAPPSRRHTFNYTRLVAARSTA